MSALAATNDNATIISLAPASSQPADTLASYIDQHQASSLFHLPGWAYAAEHAYGYKDVSQVALCDGQLVGYLPLVDVRSPLLGRSLISSPFCVGGGPLYDSREALQALLTEAEKLGRETKAKYVELRADVDAGPEWREKKGVYATFKSPLIEDENIALRELPRRRRASLRKALEMEKRGELDILINDDFDLFYQLYGQALNAHGTPIYPRAYLLALKESFGDRLEISFAYGRGKPVATLLSFYFKGVAYPYYNGFNNRAREFRTAEYLIWKLMRRAVDRGCTHFDFGRSKVGTGAFEHKKLWGMPPRPDIYRYRLADGQDVPNINPQNKKFAHFVSLWKKMPTAVTNRLGPLIAQNFP